MANNNGLANPTAEVTKTSIGRRSALAGFLGTALEYYDFFIYGMAASLVFGTVFFGGGAAAMFASFATFGVSYVARPFGAIVFGHFGDKFGRKRVLLIVLTLMGVATLLIGCLPTYDQVGWIAPALLVVLRLCQGFSAGAEVAGTATITMENSPAGKRGFYCSFTITGCNLGIILANLVFLPIQALPEADRLSWGWRIPFLVSVVITVVAYICRRMLVEPEDFSKVKEAKKTAKLPLGELLRSDWQTVLRVVIMILYVTANTLITVFALAFATKVIGIDSRVMLWAVIASNALGMIVQPLGAFISDKIGRRPVFIFGSVGLGLSLPLYFMAITTMNPALIILAGLLVTGLFYSSCNGIYQSFFPELFTTKIRYSGVALGLQIGLLLAGFTPAIAQLITGGEANWTPAVIFFAGVCVVSGLAAFFTRETYKTPLEELGLKKPKK